MKGIDRISLIDAIGRQLQADLTYKDIKIYLSGFGIDINRPTSDKGNSKWVYVKDLIASEDNSVIFKIANDLGVEHNYHSDIDLDLTDSPFWEPNHFRLFLSHLSSFREKATSLKNSLSNFGISAFVAHESIEPTREWQDEIEKALHSMDALAAILTSGFSESKWTDQEIGMALGRNILVIPIKKEIDPYGFISKYQTIDTKSKKVKQVSQAIFRSIAHNSKTKFKLSKCLTKLLVTSSSEDEAQNWIDLLRDLPDIPKDHLELIQVQSEKSAVIRENRDVLDNVNSILEKYGLAGIVFSDDIDLDGEDLF